MNFPLTSCIASENLLRGQIKMYAVYKQKAPEVTHSHLPTRLRHSIHLTTAEHGKNVTLHTPAGDKQPPPKIHLDNSEYNHVL